MFKNLLVVILISIFTCKHAPVGAQFYTNCDDSPCQHGTCEDLYKKTAYKCHCYPGFEGNECEKAINKIELFDHDIDLYSTTLSPDFIKCGAECNNGGTCDPIDSKCKCRPGYHGLYCEQTLFHSKSDVEKIYSSHQQCSYACTKGAFSNGHVCHYKNLDGTRACICHQIGDRVCLSVLDDFNACAADCQSHYTSRSSLKNSTRFCNFFYLGLNMEPITKACRCVHSQEEAGWCVFHNYEPQAEVGLWSLIRSVVSFFSFVFLIYSMRLLVGWCFECFAFGVCIFTLYI